MNHLFRKKSLCVEHPYFGMNPVYFCKSANDGTNGGTNIFKPLVILRAITLLPSGITTQGSTMSSSVIFSPTTRQHFRTTLGCWLVCLVAIVGQCSFSAYFIYATQPTLISDLIWYIESWGVWLLVTPFLFNAYYQKASAGSLSLKDLFFLGGCALMAAFILQVILKVVIDESTELMHAIGYFIPRYCAATFGLTLVWIWHNKNLMAKLWNSPEPDQPLIDNIDDNVQQNNLLVYKGRDKKLISLDEIQAVIAAKNYLEIYCTHGEYLMRGTIKMMESCLPESEFIKTHRSALIRQTAITRFKTLASGNGVAVLPNGYELPVSKSFMSSLNRFKKVDAQ
jgi:two-component system, LytTR family, response regulator